MISSFAIFEILQEFFSVLINWGEALYNFLFTEITVLGYDFVPFYALPVVGVALLIVGFIRG